jgi:hypothetical protein
MIIQAGTHNYNLYILEQPSSWSTSRIRLSWPLSRLRLSLDIPCLPWPAKYVAVCSNSSGFTLNPFIAVQAASVQVNNIAKLHDTHGHTYIHHISITTLLLFHTSSILLGRPAVYGTLPPAGLPTWVLPHAGLVHPRLPYACSSCPPAGRCRFLRPLPPRPLVLEAQHRQLGRTCKPARRHFTRAAWCLHSRPPWWHNTILIEGPSLVLSQTSILLNRVYIQYNYFVTGEDE